MPLQDEENSRRSNVTPQLTNARVALITGLTGQVSRIYTFLLSWSFKIVRFLTGVKGHEVKQTRLGIY